MNGNTKMSGCQHFDGGGRASEVMMEKTWSLERGSSSQVNLRSWSDPGKTVESLERVQSWDRQNKRVMATMGVVTQ